MVPWRSLLFVSADDPARLAKVHTRGADCVILDLEDAVPHQRKPDARAGLSAEVDRLAAAGQTLTVRINSEWLNLVDDLKAAVRPGVSAIVVPKVENAGRLIAISEILAELAPDATERPALIALIENAAGLACLDAIAEVPELIGIALGSEDFALSMGVRPTPHLLDLPVRQIGLAASRRGMMAIGCPISIAEFRDMDAYADAIAKARDVGMNGTLCIHPDQVRAANAGFGSSEAELEEARAILAAWNATGGKGVIKLEGRMIDLPVVLRAEQLLARA